MEDNTRPAIASGPRLFPIYIPYAAFAEPYIFLVPFRYCSISCLPSCRCSFYSPPVLSLRRRDVLFPFSVISFARFSLQIVVYAPFFCIYRPIHTLPSALLLKHLPGSSRQHTVVCVCVRRSITTALLCSKAELWLIKGKQRRTGLMRGARLDACELGSNFDPSISDIVISTPFSLPRLYLEKTKSGVSTSMKPRRKRERYNIHSMMRWQQHIRKQQISAMPFTSTLPLAANRSLL